METTRRGFLAALTVAPVAAALAKCWICDHGLSHVAPTCQKILGLPVRYVEIGEITPIRPTNAMMLLEEEHRARVEETVRNLGVWIDREYTGRNP
jgi:hypothetical protein